jgi:hypothetical protein
LKNFEEKITEFQDKILLKLKNILMLAIGLELIDTGMKLPP